MILSTFAMCALVQIIYEWDQTSSHQCGAQTVQANVTSVGTLFFVRVCPGRSAAILGYASDFLPRNWLLFVGCVIWGSVTTVMAFVSAWRLYLPGPGVGLAAILPVITTWLGMRLYRTCAGASSVHSGAFQMLGGILSIEFATNLSVQKDCWNGRVAFHFSVHRHTWSCGGHCCILLLKR